VAATKGDCCNDDECGEEDDHYEDTADVYQREELFLTVSERKLLLSALLARLQSHVRHHFVLKSVHAIRLKRGKVFPLILIHCIKKHRKSCAEGSK